MFSSTDSRESELQVKKNDLLSSFHNLKQVDSCVIPLENLENSVQTNGQSCSLLVEKIKQTKAEIDVVKGSPISVLPESAQIQYEVVQNELERSVTELANTLTFINAEARELEIEIQEEEQLNDQLSEVIIDSLTRRLNEQNFETSDTEGAREKLKSDIAAKKVKANAYFKQLLKDSSQFCGKYFKLPTEQEFNEVQKKLRSADKTMTVRNMLSLKDIISELMNKCFDEPNQPYIVLDKRFWPPYVELLLRCQIVVRHADDSRRIKLIPFHL